MGFVAFFTVFFIGVMISLFINKKTSLFLIVLGSLFILYYFNMPLDMAEKLDQKALNINGTPDSDFYDNIEKIKKAYEEINNEKNKALNME